jgi:small subunit ribosomal protein S21
MIIVDLSKEKSIESALRTYKSKVLKVKQVQKLRERQEFTKPSVTKRKEKLKAVYIQNKKNGLD